MAPASKSKKTDGKILLGPKTPGVHLALLLLQIGAMVTTAAVGELAAHLPLGPWGSASGARLATKYQDGGSSNLPPWCKGKDLKREPILLKSSNQFAPGKSDIVANYTKNGIGEYQDEDDEEGECVSNIIFYQLVW